MRVPTGNPPTATAVSATNSLEVRAGDRQICSGQGLRTFFEKMAEEGGLRIQRLLPCAMVFHASQWK